MPPLPGVIIEKAYWIHGAALKFTRDANAGYSFTLPDILPDPNSSVIVLTVNKNAEEIPPVGN